MRAQGKCESCGMRLKVGAVHYDHIIACDLGGDNSLSNCMVLCVPCHKEKTRKADMPAIAKGRRIRDREQGIRKPSTLKSRGFGKAPAQRSASRPIERRTEQ